MVNASDMIESALTQTQLIEMASRLPKAELHLHIEGTLEPELMWQLAQKHKVTLPFENVQAIKDAYQFDNLQSFLDLYYQGADVLRDEDDFYALMWAYLCKCKAQNIVHTEIMFDPQTHTQRGISYSVFMRGFERAKKQAKQELGLSVYLILSFLRHLSEQEAIETLHQAKAFYPMITAVGLDSSEVGNPPSKFAQVFEQARDLGFKLVAHAGEEGPPEYIWEAIDLLKIDRLDHGVRSSEDPKLLEYLQTQQLGLTVCPLSNLKLCVVNHMREHNIMDLLACGLLVTVNSDDPSYFGGYINENYKALINHLPMDESALKQLISNSFRASFLPESRKREWLKKIANFETASGLAKQEI